MAVTIKDVARESGVNVSTVSRALNGEYGVHVDTREHRSRGRPAAGVPSEPGSPRLVTGRSHTLALVVSDIRNPFFAEVARGAEDAAYRAGYDLMLCNSDLDPEKQMRYAQSLMEKRVDGILMNSVAALSTKQQEQLRRWACRSCCSTGPRRAAHSPPSARTMKRAACWRPSTC